MDILVLADLHSQYSILRKLDIYLSDNKFGAVFMCGDLCDAHDSNNLKFANDFIDLTTIKNKTPLYAVHGNQETAAVKLLYQQMNVAVHFNPKKLISEKITNWVVGVGFGDTFPTDPTFAKDKILLTHEPPRAATIKLMQSKAYLPNAPLVHFCGHRHNIAKVTKIGETQLIQVPSAQRFRAAICQLPEMKVNFIHF